MLSDSDLRIKALELANLPIISGTEVVERAQKFLDFLQPSYNASSPSVRPMPTWRTPAEPPVGWKFNDPDAKPVAPLGSIFWDDDFDRWAVYDNLGNWYSLSKIEPQGSKSETFHVQV